jgi:SAM-dependent methyltransferase
VIPDPHLGTATDDPRTVETVFAPLDTALLEPLLTRLGPDDAVADIGPGAGGATLALATCTARVHAVDIDPHTLTALGQRADAAGLGDRVHVLRHDLDDGPPPLPEPVALVWSSACVHHTLDHAATVRGLAGLLAPGGVLALGEGGLPTRSLPWDVGTGRPGLEVRLDAAHDSWFHGWHTGRAGVVRETRGWPELLRTAGLQEVTSRTALLDLPAPLTGTAHEVALALLTARVGRARDHLSAEDTATWQRLLDPDDPAFLGHHPGLHLLTARTLHTGTRA